MLANGRHHIAPGKVATIITHLEMTTPRPLEETHLPDEVLFRQVTPDLDWYRDIFMRVGGLDWLWYGRLGLADDALRLLLDDPKIAFFTLTSDGVDAALLELDFRQEDACELAYFGLTSDLIGTGAGRFLMNEAIRLAWAQPISRFHLRTCTFDSPQALGFYRRFGFTPVRQTVEIDDDPGLTGILPEASSPRVPILRS